MILIPILLIIGGVLAASSLIVQKQPNAREMIAKLVPFQGILGIILLVWGVIAFFSWGFFFLRLIPYAPISALVVVISIVVTILLGFLLGYGLINQYVLSKNTGAAQSGESMHAKLARIQVPIGIVAILLGLWALISYFAAPVTFVGM